MNLYFFFSQESSAQSPQLRAYAQRVRELLEEMAQRPKGKLRLSVIDPKPFSEDEDRAGEFGLSAVPLSAGGESVYFGLAGTNSTDGREIIGLFQPDKEEFLEYDVASLIYRLSNAKRATVGLLSGLPVDAQFDQRADRCRRVGRASRNCESCSELRTLQPDGAEIPNDIGVLMVMHPKELSPQALYCHRSVRHARRQADQLHGSAGGERQRRCANRACRRWAVAHRRSGRCSTRGACSSIPLRSSAIANSA